MGTSPCFAAFYSHGDSLNGTLPTAVNTLLGRNLLLDAQIKSFKSCSPFKRVEILKLAKLIPLKHIHPGRHITSE